MGKQYIPGVSGLLTEQNPVDAPSNTLSQAENIVVEQGGKVQARHGFNINHKKNTTDLTDSSLGSSYIYSSQYTNVLPFIKLLEYKDSNDVDKTVLFVKQTLDSYAFNNYGIYKVVGSTSTKNRYYLIDDQGEITGYKNLPYATVNNVFNTKETLYLQTENGIAEANIDNISSTDPLNFFDVKWPAFPDITYELKDSQLYGNWLKGGKKCYVRMTFYRELGYTDKPNDIMYESEPSVPTLIQSFNTNSIPSISLKFKTQYDELELYKQINEFTKLNGGRKFGIRLYRTKIVDINETIPDEYFQCCPDIPFENFLAGEIEHLELPEQENITWKKELNNNPTIIEVSDGSAILSNSLKVVANSVITDQDALRVEYRNIASIFMNGDPIKFKFSSPGLISGINENTVYYVINKKSVMSSNSVSPSNDNYQITYFQISDTINGPAKSLTFAGTGTISIYYHKFDYYYKFNTSSLNIELNIGDYIDTIYPNQYDNTSVSPYITINDNNLEFSTSYKLPIKTTDTSVYKNSLSSAKLKVVEKRYDGISSYFYKFSTDDYIYQLYKKVKITAHTSGTSIVNTDDYYSRITLNSFNNNIVNVELPLFGKIGILLENNSIVGNLISGNTYDFFTWTNSNPYYIYPISSSSSSAFSGQNAYIIPILNPQSSIRLKELAYKDINSPLKIVFNKSYTIDLSIGDAGIDGQNKLYTDSNIDGAGNTNTFVSISNNSLKYKDFWVYHGIQKPLEGYIYVTKQPDVDNFKLTLDPRCISDSTSAYLSIFNTTDIKNLPNIINSIDSFGKNQRFFMDCPIFKYYDPEIKTITQIQNDPNYTIETISQSAIKFDLTDDQPYVDLVQNATFDTSTDSYKELFTSNNISFNIINNTVTLQAVSPYANLSLFNNGITSIRFYGGTLPNPLALNTFYYVKEATQDILNNTFTFKLSNSSADTGYSIIDLTTNSIGTITASVKTRVLTVTKSSLSSSIDISFTNQFIAFVENVWTNKSIKYKLEPFNPETAYYVKTIDTNLYIPITLAAKQSNLTSIYALTQNSFIIAETYLNASIYSQSKLSLRLVSNNGIIDDVSIKTLPIYNRKGYYNKYLENQTLDTRCLEFDLKNNNANGIYSTQGNGITPWIDNSFASLGDSPNLYNIPGNDKGQAIPDGIINPAVRQVATTVASYDNALNTISTTFGSTSYSLVDAVVTFYMTGTNSYLPANMERDKRYYMRNIVQDGPSITFQISSTPTGPIIDIGTGFGTLNCLIDSSNFIYVKDQSDGGTLIVQEATVDTIFNFNIAKFSAPGFMFIQSKDSNNKWNTSLISYSSYESGYGSSCYRFRNVKFVMGSSIVPYFQPTFINQFAASTKYCYAIKAASVEEIPIYPYSDPPNISSISRGWSSNYGLILKYDQTDPHFTIVPHKSKTEIPVATLNRDGTVQFYGAAAGYAKSSTELLDEYAYSIIDKFNAELKLKNINAFLFKGENAGEIGIIYPDGKSIEIKNDFGSHEFLPNINNQSIQNSSEFYKLAERITNEYEEKNMIQWSRRNIPEITTGLLYKYLGKNNKKIIGMGANTDDLYIFKEDGIWRCTDSGSLNDFDLPVISDYLFSNNFICQSAGSIQEINDEIIFLSQYGFASIANGGIQLIDQSINRDIVTLLAVSPKDRIRSFVNESKNLYYCTLINETDPNLNVKSGTYVFNARTRQWSFMDEEILTGIEDSQTKSVVAFRQRPIKAKRTATKTVSGRQIPVFDFTNESTLDNYGYIARSQETTPLDMFYIAREQHTNNVKRNAVDQYDFKYSMLNDDSSTFFNKSDTNEFYFITESVPNVASDKVRHKFRSSAHIALRPDSSTPLPADTDTAVIDSYISMFANRSIYLQKVNSSLETYEIRLKKTDTNGNNLQVYFEFVGVIPTWFNSLSNGSSFSTASTYRILAGIPVKITFNPESGSAPDTNKLFQEYMIHTETANRGAVMSFKTDSRSNLTSDRRFVYDAATTNRNVFRTYIPMNASRGRYLIRQIKHDLPLENLIITGQTVVMRDSGSTRVQKDKDNE